MRKAFGKELSFEDIYQHLTDPDRLYLFIQEGKISAMGSYNTRILSGLKCSIVEGIAIDPKFQGKGIFKSINDVAYKNEPVVCLRTQNPRMYAALEDFCSKVYPNKEDLPKSIRALREDFASYLKCEINDKGVINGHYGGLFYGVEPKHERYSKFFKEDLEMDLSRGDAVLLVGTP